MTMETLVVVKHNTHVLWERRVCCEDFVVKVRFYWMACAGEYADLEW